VESMSDAILKIMKKGVMALQNIQLLKWCRELGIVPLWNLIWGFPGEPEEEYDRMAKLVPLLVHLHPPCGFGKITLDRFSPYFVNPVKYGIDNIRPWVPYQFIYPTLSDKELYKIAYHFDFDYIDAMDPATYTKELEQQLTTWKSLWNAEDNRTKSTPPALNMVAGDDMIMIKDTRPCSLQSYYTLLYPEAKVYDICKTMHTFQTLFIKMQQQHPDITEDELKNTICNLHEKRLLLCDNENYLSLATQLS
jgi:hypothetical protein